MSFHLNKKTFKTDEITGEIIQPQVFLCNRQLDKLGELYPVLDLRIKAALNGADEISFRLPKKEGNLYDSLKDYSVVFVAGFGYFEVSPTVSDTFTSIKNVQGSSLGEAELSQLFCTLECNTDQVMSNFLTLHPGQKYIPTVLYSEDTKYSLLHKILENAPNYSVGNVDDTLRHVQRTYSFSNKDIISCFSEIAEEIGCIFEVDVNKNDDGIVEKTVNVYDAQYCTNCKSRHIINGVCQDCQSTNIAGIGSDTTIQISTDNLSDEITISPDGNMKNCFIIEGGDDMINNAITGIMPSGTNKLIQFSEDTLSAFSPLLQKKYKEYVASVNLIKNRYAKTLEIQYSILDLILYLQSGRMPNVIETKRKLDEEAMHIITQFKLNFSNGLAWRDKDDKSPKNSMVKQALSLFMDRGYSLKLENGSYNRTSMRWTGNIILYESANYNSTATISVSETNSTITYSDSQHTETVGFYIKFSDHSKTYMQLMTAITEKKFIEDRNNPKEWGNYSLNRLASYESAYQACKEVLEEIKNESSLPSVKKTADNMIAEYNTSIKEISNYMVGLKDMVYHLYCYLSNSDEARSLIPSSQDINFSSTPRVFKDTKKAFRNMVHYIWYGTWEGGSEHQATDHPLHCKDCGSTNVTLTSCNQCKHTHIVTYGTLAEAVYNDYVQFGSTGSLESQREATRNAYKLNHFLGDDLYKELCSFLREDTYSNTNFISDGLSNSELIAKAKSLIERAQQELAKACISQHTLSGNVYAFVAYSKLNPDDFPIQDVYREFRLGNFMWYFTEDGHPYKLRLSSEEFSWTSSGAELTVEFTDVIEYKDGGISDLASLMQSFGNLSTSFHSVMKQAEQGVKANNTFTAIKNRGLHSALANVLNARDIDVQIDDRGITLRRFDYDLDDYSPYQMKLVNRNIVMTENNWDSASLAIGLGRYNNELVYGVWANLLVGDLTITKELHVKNENNSIIIDEHGITLDGGAITWKSPIEQSAVEGLSAKLNTFVENTVYISNIEELQKQIDGSITTWFQDGVPTQSNYPANEWKTEKDKNAHLGDLYYDNKTGFAYRYQKSNSTYSWERIKDTDVVKALQDAQKAQDTADGKRRVFVVTPIPPYDEGDLWTQGSDGDLFRCKTPKKQGQTFSQTDWVIATKYTDDTKAVEALNKATQAIKAASSAQTDATSKITALDQAVAKYLGLPGATTIVGSNYVVSPYIEGGYLNITGTSNNVSNQVIIDPKNQTASDYIFAVKHGNDVTVGIKPDGTATFDGTIRARNGIVGGWYINNTQLSSSISNDAEQYSYKLLLSSNDYSVTSQYVHNTDSPRYGIQYDTTKISQGVISCQRNNITSMRAGHNSIFDYEVELNGIGMTCTDIKNDRCYYALNEYSLTVDVPAHFDNGIYEYGKALSEKYCVVKTKTLDAIGINGGFIELTANFGVSYRSAPFVNVMPISDFLTKNIHFVEFIGNSSTGYTGFKYKIYTTSSNIHYVTRWFAVGNIR